MESFNDRLSNEKIAPVIAEVGLVTIPNLMQEFTQSPHGLSNHHFTHLFASYQGQWKLWNIGLLFRAQFQLGFYQQAFDATQEFLYTTTKQSQDVDTYFKVVTLWETSFINFQIFVDLYNEAFGENLFCKGDGNKGQRAYDIATTIEHWTTRINGSRHNVHHTTPLWLSSKGFHTDKRVISYIEFSSLIREISRTAEILQTPNAR